MIGTPDLPLWHTERDEWRAYAACIDTDLSVFFPTGAVLDYGPALAICETCVVTTDCLDAELQANPRATAQHGVYGGLTPDQRAALIRERNAA